MPRVQCQPELAPRMREIAEMLSRGDSLQKCARSLGVSLTTVKSYVRESGKRIPGDLSPRFKMILWHRSAPVQLLWHGGATLPTRETSGAMLRAALRVN